ncbi:uncharacterized protein DUF4296 [Mucilaginibacter gracilis]|uniref:Uncharacterized protein DUF4296 n=1 Tax=Mucilaginibacter gracilis TaxID=423350 RepID=A0A495J9F4_9SPHI|nr:DUF4296 domain-containing protein [Mucilaginibacter gracilis]RKR85537.1 uncharacterized protein DUF4296 [Mucilaginibacter gracilis]
MRFYLILFFCVGFLFTSCSDGKKIPSDVIPEHDMAELLTDIHIVDGSLYDLPQMPDTLSKHGMGLYLAVFKVHHVDTTLFKKSIKFYSTRPDLLGEIYTGITERLQKKIDSLQKHKPKMNQDSLKKANVKRAADSIKTAKARLKLDSAQRAKGQRTLDSLQKRSNLLRAPQNLKKPKRLVHVVPL